MLNYISFYLIFIIFISILISLLVVKLHIPRPKVVIPAIIGAVRISKCFHPDRLFTPSFQGRLRVYEPSHDRSGTKALNDAPLGPPSKAGPSNPPVLNFLHPADSVQLNVL